MTDSILNQAILRVATLTEIVRRVTHAEMTAAAFALAWATRVEHPGACSVVLVDSDQGDWLTEVSWVDEDGVREDLELPEDGMSLAWHLYSEQVHWLACIRHERRSTEYVLDIDAALALGAAPPVIAEVLAVRDPDGPTSLSVAIAGVLPEGLSVAEFHVDAGAGFEWEEWVEHRDDALGRASAAMRPGVLTAFQDPPGGQYVEGREVPWLTGVIDDTRTGPSGS